MDCRTAQFLLAFQRPGELDPPQAMALEQHLASCLICAPLSIADRAFDDSIRVAMADVPMPIGLHDRITHSVGDRTRRIRRRQFVRVSVAMAACALVGLGAWGWQRQPQELDTDLVAVKYDAQAREPYNQAIGWLADQNLRFTPAMPLDPTLLVGFENVEFQGRTVPMLLLINHRERVFARVYVVKARQFDIHTIQTAAQQSNCGVRVLADRDEPDRLAYIVVFTGASLDPFLSQEFVPLA